MRNPFVAKSTRPLEVITRFRTREAQLGNARRVAGTAGIAERGSNAPRDSTELVEVKQGRLHEVLSPARFGLVPALRSSLRQAAVTLVAISSAVALPSCTVGPDYHKPEAKAQGSYAELKQTTSANPATQPSAVTDRAQPLVEWWTTFRDPELESLVQRTMADNLNLHRSASRILQSRAELRVAGADLYPRMRGTAGYDRSRGSKNVAFPLSAFGGSSSSSSAGPHRLSPQQASGGGGGGASATPLGGPMSPLGEGGLPGVTTDIYQIGFDASWEIDVFGGTRRSVEAAAADYAAAVEDRRDALVSLVAEVARDYLQLRGFQQRLAIAHDNLASQRDSLELTRSRFSAGFVTQLDVARAQTQVAQTQATIPALESQVRLAIHALSTLLAQDPDALSGELMATGPLPAAPPTVPIGLPSELLRRRPDIRRAERQLAAANARVGVATADLYPKFSITGQLGLDSTKVKRLFEGSSAYFLLSPGVSWNLFEAGRIRATSLPVPKRVARRPSPIATRFCRP